MKKVILFLPLFLYLASVSAQTKFTFQDSVKIFFTEIRRLTQKWKNLWGANLYGPILLVDPGTRQLYANFQDTAGVLRQDGEIYTGVLPNEQNIANTAINWNGRRWAMLMLPLPGNKHARLHLLAHELFHVKQPSLGFELFNIANNHLDEKNGRIYLRLELEALLKAVQSTGKTEQKAHLADALTFRKYRYLLYPAADSTENLLELNEGIAEYTGIIMSGRNKEQAVTHFAKSINSFIKKPTFVRSFAYETTPVYGYLLAKAKKNWHKEIAKNTNLTNYFIKSFNLPLPFDLKKSVDLMLNRYNGALITAEETAREEKAKKQVAEYKSKFIDQPHFEIFFEQMQISFDPGNIIPVEDKGTVYPNMRISDNWGILTVTNGALMSNSWDKISITPPLNTETKKITGEGWSLELKEGYLVRKDDKTGNFKLSKK